MIEKELIETLANEVIGDYFLVEVAVSSSNEIDVLIDSEQSVSISKCIEISRYIESKLDREVEDFELSVSSAGLGNPFKVYRQYVKNIGNEVEVAAPGKSILKGILKSADELGFEIEVKTLEKVEGKKKKEEVIRIHRFGFDNEQRVRNIISFK